MKQYREDDIIIDNNLYFDCHGQPVTGIISFDDGEVQYVVDGKLHRIDGPSCTGVPVGQIRTRGVSRSPYEWHIDDVEYTFEEFVIKAEWTEDQIIEWKLTHD